MENHVFLISRVSMFSRFQKSITSCYRLVQKHCPHFLTYTHETEMNEKYLRQQIYKLIRKYAFDITLKSKCRWTFWNYWTSTGKVSGKDWIRKKMKTAKQRQPRFEPQIGYSNLYWLRLVVFHFFFISSLSRSFPVIIHWWGPSPKCTSVFSFW